MKAKALLTRPWFMIFVSVTFVIIVAGVSNHMGFYYWRLSFAPAWSRKIDPGIVGIVLPTVTSMVTFMGFWFTVARLSMLLRRIRTFEEFLTRANEVIDDARRHGKTVKIICHSPPIGNLSAHTSGAFKEFTRKLRDASYDFEILCLEDGQLKLFYNSYCPPFDQNFVNKQLAEAELLIADWLHIHRSGNSMLIRQKYENIPHFYMLFSTRQAIIANVLYLPRLVGAGGGGGSPGGGGGGSGAGGASRRNVKPFVEIIGYETTDGSVIAECQKAFDHYSQP